MGPVRAEEPEMKGLLALTFLLAFLALGLSEPDTDRDVELLREQLAVRDKREPAKGGEDGRKKGLNKKNKPKRKNSKGKKEFKARKKTGNKRIAGGKKRKSIPKKRKNKGKKKTTANGNKKKRKLNKRKRKNLEKKNKKKEKRRQKGKKSEDKRKKKRKQRGKRIEGRNTRTCSDSTTVSNECLQEAVDVLKYLRNQVRTFNRKFARIKSFNKTVGNKLGKKGVFEETAAYLLLALGGNISSAACGETGSRQTNSREKATAVSTYNVLNNCSASIKEACTMPNTTLSDEDITTFATCTDTFNKTAMAADDCRTNSKYSSNGTAACTCWSKIVAGINKVKQSGACNTTETNDGVKESKNTCMEAFSACRKAEDSAVQLVYTCGSGEVANSTKSTS